MFLALVEGAGEGCDYTIDCNKTWTFLEAKTWDEIETEVINEILDYYTCTSEPESIKERLKQIKIIEIKELREFDLDNCVATLKEKGRKEKEEKEDEIEFERLKKKLNR